MDREFLKKLNELKELIFIVDETLGATAIDDIYNDWTKAKDDILEVVRNVKGEIK